MSVSYDGGITWIGGFMPGIPEDTSPAANSLPTRLEAMSDPVLLSGACGRFYAFFLYFTRNSVSKQMLARFQDLTNDELNHTIKFLGFTEIDTGNNAQNGLFLDKLSATLVPTGATDCSQVTEYVVANVHDLQRERQRREVPEPDQLRQVHGRREDVLEGLGRTRPSTQNQGTSVVVNPVTKDILVFWRSFNSPHTMMMRKQRANGAWENPIDLLATDPLTTLRTLISRPD